MEPKRKSQQESSKEPENANTVATGAIHHGFQPEEQQANTKKMLSGKKGAPLRRSRIIITVKRTDDYRRWLEENPYPATGHSDDIES